MTNKIDTKECKLAIVEYCKNNIEDIKKQFVSGTEDESLFEKSFLTKNWKRRDKYKVDSDDLSCIECSNEQLQKINLAKKNKGIFYMRMFDCEPFDDQLRGYVLSTNDEIYWVGVQGE